VKELDVYLQDMILSHVTCAKVQETSTRLSLLDPCIQVGWALVDVWALS